MWATHDEKAAWDRYWAEDKPRNIPMPDSIRKSAKMYRLCGLAHVTLPAICALLHVVNFPDVDMLDGMEISGS